MSAPEMASKPLFPLARTRATPQVLAVLEAHGVAPASLLERHARRDWGDLCTEDVEANREALRQGSRIFSIDLIGEGVKAWVITEADRSATTLLMPDDY